MNRDGWSEYYAGIDAILDEDRPARAGVGERGWRERAYGWARNHIPNESEIVRHFADSEVDRREGIATKQGHKHLRNYGHGQAPLEWAMLGPKPIKVGDVRVRYDAATPEDVDDAARELETKAKHQYDEEVLLVGTMRDLARDARRNGFEYVAQIGDQIPFAYPGEDDDDDEDE